MKRIVFLICAGAFVLASCNNDAKSDTVKTDSSGNSSTKEEAWVPVPDSVAMQKMMEYGTPGPMHAMMASWSGTWNGETTMWMKDGAPPQTSKGKAVNTMILGGKYQSSKHSGDMMGMPFEGQSVMGYDNATKEFTSTWIDNMSTGVMIMKGNWDEASKTLTLTGTMPDITRPGKECKLKETFKVIDDNNQLMAMYGPDPATGKEYKMMEIKMTRQK